MRQVAIPKLLRAIAGGSDAKANRHDVIFNAAADETERLWVIEDELNHEREIGALSRHN